MCEWLVYYVYFLGDRLYFMFYDVGGFYFDVWMVLEFWIKVGRVLVYNIC